MLKIVKGFYLAIICLFLVACGPLINTDQPVPEAIDGVIDLRDWDFEKDGSINLSGEWVFFWGELLQPDQITKPNQGSFVAVPDTWTNYDVAGIELPPEGYATYSLTLYPPDAHQTYGLYIEGEGSAYVLWADGHLIAQNGLVGTSSDSMTPEKKPVTVFFELAGETVELVLQVSNFHHRKGGFRNGLLLGTAETIHRYQLQNWFIEAFSVGILFTMGLYHLFIYLFRTKNKASLYFALLCWMMTVRTGLTNQNTLLFHLPSISWPLAFRIEYLSFFLAPIPFVLFLKTLYPKDIHRWFVRAIVGIGIGFALFLLFTDTLALSYTSTYYQIVYLLGIVYCLVFLGRIMIKKRTGAFYIGLASLIVFAAVIIETLILQNIIKAIYISSFLPIEQITSFSFLAFIFVQAILLANLFSKSFNRIEALSGELEETNINLEQSERKYRTIFEDSKDMIFIAGLDGQIEDVSPACVEVLGFTKMALTQMKIFDVIVNPADRDRFQNAIVDQDSVINFEFELQRKDGQVIQTLVSATTRLEENGRVTGVQGSVSDITSRKKAETERLRALKFEQISITDPLTKIYNRRFFNEVVEKEIERAKRSDSPLAVILLDIDHFKNINDTYGHLTGDQVLINLANLCHQNIRSMDFLARFGGDEFVILMPSMDRKSAQETAERLRVMVDEKPLAASEKTDVSVTISLGIADWDTNNPIGINALLNRADQALYRSKEAGRNRVMVWKDDYLL